MLKEPADVIGARGRQPAVAALIRGPPVATVRPELVAAHEELVVLWWAASPGAKAAAELQRTECEAVLEFGEPS